MDGITSVGAKFGYAIEATKGTKPTTFTQLTRINKLGGIDVSYEKIDASALEDLLTKYIKGRGDTGGEFPVTVNLTDDTLTEWQTLITAYKTAKSDGKAVWFTTYLPDLAKGFFFTGEPPETIPQPSLDQNGLVVADMNLIINDYKGPDTAIEPKPAGGA